MSKWLKLLGISSVIALLLAAVVGVALAQGPDDGNTPPVETTDDDGEHVCDCDGSGGWHMHGRQWQRGSRDGSGPHEECDREGDGHMYGFHGSKGTHDENCDCEGDGHMYGHHGGRGPHGDGSPNEECPRYGYGSDIPDEGPGARHPMRGHREH